MKSYSYLAYLLNICQLTDFRDALSIHTPKICFYWIWS